MGSCQVLKNKKIREKLRMARRHPPPYPIFFCFGNMYNNKKQLKNTKKKQIISLKKKCIRVGAWFSRIFWFFNLTKPLSLN